MRVYPKVSGLSQ